MSRVSMLDAIPTELFYEIFRYLPSEEILNAFKRLNKRMDAILGEYQQYDFDFRSCNKSKFDFVCQLISPDQIRSVMLSDADETCRQIPTFFRLFYIRHFANLRSLSLLEISEQDLQKLITKLHFCPRLSSLTIRLAQGFIPKICGLSLRHLSIGVCTMNMLKEIISSMPDLWTLTVQLVAGEIPVDESALIMTEIRRLKIELPEKSNIEYDHLGVLLQWMPKLEELAFIAKKGYRFIHGNRWEHLLGTCASQLKRFHFKIQPNLVDPDLQQILSTFKTPFWLKEKKWFLFYINRPLPSQTHFNLQKVHFFTFPYMGEQYYLSLNLIRKQLVFRKNYSSVRNLYFAINCDYNEDLLQRCYFRNLHSLTIRNSYRLAPIYRLIDLSKVKHLTIEQHNPINAEEFLSHILKHTIHLESLELSWKTLVEITKNFTEVNTCSLLKMRIKSLNLLNMRPPDDEPDDNRIKLLTRLFRANLETLKCSVTSIDDIVLILNRLRTLCTIGIECNKFEGRMNPEEALSWLMQNVPKLKNFTHRIRTISETRICLCLWMNYN